MAFGLGFGMTLGVCYDLKHPIWLKCNLNHVALGHPPFGNQFSSVNSLPKVCIIWY